MLIADLKRRRKKVFSSIFTILLGVCLLLTISYTLNSFGELSKKPLQLIGSSITVQRSGKIPDEMKGATFPCSAVTIKKAEIDKINSIKNIVSINQAILLWVFENKGFKNVLGIETHSKNGPGRIKEYIIQGKFFNNSKNEVVVEKTLADSKNIKINTYIKIAGISFKVTGIVSGEKLGKLATAHYYIPLQSAAKLALASKRIQKASPFSKGDASLLFIQTKQKDLSLIVKQIKKIMGKNITLTSPALFLKKLKGITRFFLKFAQLFIISVLLITLLITILTILSDLNQRKHEIGILKAIGWTPNEVKKDVIREVVGTTMIGAVAGILFSFILLQILKGVTISIEIPWKSGVSTPHFLKSTNIKKIMPINLPVTFEWLKAVITLIFSVITGWLIGFFSSLKTNKIKPVEAIKHG